MFLRAIFYPNSRRATSVWSAWRFTLKIVICRRWVCGCRSIKSRVCMFELAQISPSGFEDILSITTKPPIVSHTNARKYYDIERNISDEQIKMIGERRGVIGINSVLVSPTKGESTLDRYIDHIEHLAHHIE